MPGPCCIDKCECAEGGCKTGCVCKSCRCEPCEKCTTGCSCPSKEDCAKTCPKPCKCCP
ncbi:metallothionein-1 [Penaeus monodon]|uniref:Metallothionein n=2 Tax=Penaeus monodon TaxID=6687 RepID=E5KXY4_PENMO|nr:metallothionein-1 [Penaeus monodon]XP_037788684.1 metallothionein-1 [Penaeus monodon]ADQ28316.1 metallothionein [Penaeus monodon]